MTMGTKWYDYQSNPVQCTPGVALNIQAHAVVAAIVAFSHGDWGDMDDEDAAANERNSQDPRQMAMVLGAYKDDAGKTFWLMRDSSTNVTCLLPEEY